MSVVTHTTKARVYCTSKDEGGTALCRDELVNKCVAGQEHSSLIALDRTQQFQSCLGFGGGITEAAAFALAQVSPEKRDEVIRAYFHPSEGLGYQYCRTHINSCDFSLSTYDLCEEDGDVDLETFNIERDSQHLIPLLRDAYIVSGERLRVMASPWSPPAWMKTNGSMLNGGKLKPEMYPVWARYFVKYIRAYGDAGVPIWAVSVQNEPEAVQVWESCLWTAEEEAVFVLEYLHPALMAAGLDHVKIMVWDHNKDRIEARAEESLSYKDALDKVYGVGFHWYGGDHFDSLSRVKDKYPDHHLFFTEGCQEGGPHLGDWSVGERYAHEYIGDINHGASGFIDWNIALTETGGPNHVGNYCAAPVIVDTKTGEVAYQSSFSYLGHFSRFIQRGAIRIGSSTYSDIECTALVNRDGSLVVVLMNRSDEAVESCIEDRGEYYKVTHPKRSLMTIVFSDEE